MPERFELPQGENSGTEIDTTTRYDLYCREHSQDLVVYRNVLFNARRSLFKDGQFDVLADFMEIEGVNGQIAFISRTSIFKFCKSGIVLMGESIK